MAMNIPDTMDRALHCAGLDIRSGSMRSVIDTMRQALTAAGLSPRTAPAAAPAPAGGAGLADTLDMQAREIPPDPLPPETPLPTPQPVAPPAPDTPPAPEEQAPSRPLVPGRFLTRTFHEPVGSRVYKLYIPPQAAQAAPATLPLVLMLHGCIQSADDFAAGTQMNRLADAWGFLVVYPEQASGANASRCWNWFRTQDQLRDGGEPAILAGIVRSVAADQPVDPARIFVAGLSAGAAMAIILGETYPELFAAVGVHSGLPYAAAHDVPSALAAMKGRGILGRPHLPGTPDDPRRPTRHAVPVIVFHGDRDHTVQHSNGEHIVQQARHAQAAQVMDQDLPLGRLKTRTDTGSTGGRRFSRTVHTDPSGRPRVETWTLHGAGHAWSGGSPAGSYTDPKGPDASAEMLRFFLAVSDPARDT
jgi:poly(hydroxyalkanoate) depolymerase family esterase